MQFANNAPKAAATATYKNKTGTVRLQCPTADLVGGTEVTLFYDWKPSAWKEAVRLSSCKVVGLLC